VIVSVVQQVPNKHQERSMRTRALLLDAVIDSLADVGYANTSTADIAARAGVTRGAHLHHFRTRNELFAQAIEHLKVRQHGALKAAADAVTAQTSAADIMLDLVTAAFAGRLGKASVELFVAIRNEEDLREQMLRVQGSLTREMLNTCAELIGPDVSRERLEYTFRMTINLVRGLMVDEMIGRDPRRPKKLLGEWRRLAAVSLA
jgi:AcrR family transcriptional regulator